jgi:hypothetical protein
MFGKPLPSDASAEFLATPEYLVRPPMQPSYLFLVHSQALSNAETVSHISAAVATLPGDSRTLVALIVFDVHMHVFVFKPESRFRLMTVVDAVDGVFNPSDPSSVFLPCQLSDILVPLRDPSYQNTMMEAVSSMSKLVTPLEEANISSALLMGLRVMGGNGGKISLVLGRGNVIAPHKETFYKEYALEANRLQVSVDIYSTTEEVMCPQLQILPRITSGDWMPLRRLSETLASSVALEAVIRMRASSKVNIGDFTGAFYLRSRDLLSLPSVKYGQTFGASLTLQPSSSATGGTMTTPDVVYVQVALMYTSLAGARRIRVHNLALRTSAVLADVMDSLDGYALSQLYAKQLATHILDGGKPKIRDTVDQFILAWRHGMQRLQSKHTVLLYMNALSKMDMTSGATLIENVRTLVDSNELAMVPYLIRVDCESEEPISVPLSRAYLDSEGVYVMLQRDEALVWAGSKSAIGSGTPEEETVMRRVRSFCERSSVNLRGEAAIVIEDKRGVQLQTTSNLFYKRLVEDRQVEVDGSMSYLDFVNHVFSGM